MNCRHWETGISKDNWQWEKKIQGKRVLGENKFEQTVWDSQDSRIPGIPGFAGFLGFIGSRDSGNCAILVGNPWIAAIRGIAGLQGPWDLDIPRVPGPGTKEFQ